MISTIEIAALLISIAALFAYLNDRFVGLPTTIGVMVIALLVSVLAVVLNLFGLGDYHTDAKVLLERIDFNETLLEGMLSFLLFAGALHVNLNDLRRQTWVIASLATVGVCLSTFLVGTATYYLLGWCGLPLPYLYCLLFGALISPTDPIAVMATVKRLGVSKELETTIAGESLFNDGVGVVVFMVLLMLLQQPDNITAANVALIFAEEAVGGIVFGMVLGGLGFYLLNTIDNYKVEVLITLALVMGGYALAMALHTSGPIAVVVAGLLTGNVMRKHAMSDRTRESVDDFWELIDEILNVILFALIGLEMLIMPFDAQWAMAAVPMIALVVLVRVVSVGLPIQVIRLKRELAPHLVKILVWGGLRGGISVALALSLPAGPARDLILFLTYIVVVFSIIVQGLTLGPLIQRLTSPKQ
ncbi:Na(+)/H(+) antiporter NhaP [Arenicella chitinivorans]|uniref:Na(+)/H(+) antiporter NhaP n=1 Tax=Arenicella chitinivorans TaxID=1329800 RepID=A0A918RNR1_9GAMM|nr:sodium:proton antiporter [Arenicella chitinivorans]GHA07079.1 Na(+)/H(+) antiporter NhaP [Arenicella chitinivorans]